jgi:2-amino-4-hydroxy-6-hydroxymethyldihydropteridine diphosphokinase
MLDAAVANLRVWLREVRVSSWHETAPVGVDQPQPDYLNGAISGVTRHPPHSVLDALLGIEAALGRARPNRNAPRTIDLDLILYDGVVVDEPGLSVPHPRFREREFVLAPLAEVAGDMIDPVTGLTVEALLNRLRARGA